MPTKSIKENVPATADLCYALLLDIGNSVKGWRNDKTDNNPRTYTWKWGNLWKNPGKTIITVDPISDGETLVTFTVKNLALADPFGILNGELKKIRDPFKVRLPSILDTATQKGMMCPTCGNLVPEGTRYCSNDGTPIALICPSCDFNNVPNVKFCSNCGQQL